MLNGITAIGASIMMFVSVTWGSEKELIFWGFVMITCVLIEILKKIK